MYVVQALASLDIGGSELVAVETAEHLCAQGHRVAVLAAAGPLADRVTAAGGEVLEWPVGRKRPGTLRYVRRLRSWLADEPPDIVHAHSRLPAWVCRLAMRKLPDPVRPVFVTSIHGQYSVSPYSAIMTRGDRVIAVSRHVRDHAFKHYPGVSGTRLHVIHGGVDHSLFPHGYRPPAQWWKRTLAEYPVLSDKRLLLLPARLSRYKGHAAFIRLIAALSADFDDIHGVILGQSRTGSKYERELRRLAGRHAVSGRLTFAGPRIDVRDWMSASSLVFNLCSEPPEAFGRTVPEALALGIPVVAWNHGGVRETLAVLFPRGAVEPGDEAALLRTTAGFLRRPPAVKASAAFSLQDSMRQTLDLYQGALDERTRHATA